MGGGCIAQCKLYTAIGSHSHTIIQLQQHKADLKSLGAERLLALWPIEGQGQNVVEDLLGAQ